jgi:phosphatidylserine decarboxylase
MNGFATGRSPYDYGGSTLQAPADRPGGRAAVDEFKKNMLRGEDPDDARYAAVCFILSMNLAQSSRKRRRIRTMAN